MNVLSLFDGASCGQQALEMLGVEVDNYFSSEIDKYAISVTRYNYPDTIFLGSVIDITIDGLDNGNILINKKHEVNPKETILIGGSPCFIAGTMVITKDVIKNIEDVIVGDLVLTHTNTFKEVLAVGGRNNVEIVSVFAQGIPKTETTSEHPFYVREMNREWDNDKKVYSSTFSEPFWKPAIDLKKGDFVGINILNTNENKYHITNEFSFYKEVTNQANCTVIDGIIWLPIKKIVKEEYRKDVYNLEVATDNSYTANGMIVHNCQGFSFAGKRKGASTKCNIKITTLKQYLTLKKENFEFEGQSYLFWEYVRIKKELEKYNKNLIFLLENVKMDKTWKEMFDKTINVTPVRINSSLVSAQTRDRFYWTSKQNIPQPVDREIFWNSIQMNNAEEVMYYSPQAFEWIFKSEDRKKRFKTYTNQTMSKMQMVEASHNKGYSNQRCFGIMDNTRMRYIHVIECERLQTMKDNYTARGLLEDGTEVKISNTQRYRMIGNGWTVAVIAHIFSFLLEEDL